MSEVLYNGIILPDEWPPRDQDPASTEPMRVTYLETPPAVIPIDVGRQLFVDDFLIAETTLQREFHLARKHDANPVMRPETPLEKATPGIFPAAVPKDGGVWWDPRDALFKMWYEAGWVGAIAYATSKDGIHWERPTLDVVPPTNQVVKGLVGDSGAVVLDLDTPDPAQRFKMFHREHDPAIGMAFGPGNSLVSADGIHWSEPVKTGPVEDRSSLFYNPFRKRWVYSIRRLSSRGRIRHYREHADFLAGAPWTGEEVVFWCGADRLDAPDTDIGDPAQLYNLNAVAYESIMLGLFEIHLGPDNTICDAGGFPKITELKTAFSRNGFHWHRPDRHTFIPASRRAGAWDRGYVQPVGGICLIMGDELWFYYSGFAGDPANPVDKYGYSGGMHSHGSTGIAKLRRDGFASMTADSDEGTLTTRPLTFSGKHLFVNAAIRDGGALRAELLDRDGQVIAPFTLDQSVAFTGDRTCVRLEWKHGHDLSALAGQPVRLRFTLTVGSLYAFWVSGSERGESGGYVAAGGPGFTSSRDMGGIPDSLAGAETGA